MIDMTSYMTNINSHMMDISSYLMNINLHMMNMNMNVNTKINVNVNIMPISMSILWFWGIDIHKADEATLSIDLETFLVYEATIYLQDRIFRQ